MYILLQEGDIIRDGDEFYDPRGQRWLPIPQAWSYDSREVRRIGEGVGGPYMHRRKLTGWEAVKHALKTEVLGNDKEGCETTHHFWECECDDNHIHHVTDREHSQCCECGADEYDQPDARKADVILKIMEE